eukprot:m.147367 g.147367  ORF g.147367 m.147367 type:complete len:90 (+) comp52730_c0_seq7:438-707(+)
MHSYANVHAIEEKLRNLAVGCSSGQLFSVFSVHGDVSVLESNAVGLEDSTHILTRVLGLLDHRDGSLETPEAMYVISRCANDPLTKCTV